MSTHDRGAFGQLLAEAKALGARPPKHTGLRFEVYFDELDEEQRWYVVTLADDGMTTGAYARGRTGEEALRRLVEKLRPVV